MIIEHSPVLKELVNYAGDRYQFQLEKQENKS